MKKKKTIFFIIVAVLVLIFLGTFIIIKQNKNKTVSTCIVQFESSGGTKIELQEIEKGLKVVKPENPVKEGFSFIEWQLNGQAYNFDSIVTENLILNAKWEANLDTVICIVVFDSDGGSEVKSVDVAQGSSITAPIAPIKKGFTFKGWYLEGEKFDFSNPIIENITLKAKWKEGEVKIEDKTIDISEGVITTTSDEVNENASYEEVENIVSDYLGKWYLKGYSDIYIIVKKSNYSGETSMGIEGINIANKTLELYPLFKDIHEGDFGCDIIYKNFKEDLTKKNIYLNGNQINIKSLTFVREKGAKDKYDYFGAIYKKAEGTWYLENNPKVTITVRIDKNEHSGVLYDLNSDNYSISTQSNGEIVSFTDYRNGTDNTPFNKYGITIDGETLYYKYQGNTKKFYKNITYISINEVSLEPSTLTLHVGDKEVLIPSIKPDKAYYISKDDWNCSNLSVIKCSGGQIEAVGVGEATISYKVVGYDKEYFGYCKVNVIPNYVTNVSLNKTNITLLKGDSETIFATISPTNATNKNIIWSSNNSEIASVNSNGVIMAKGAGTATITAKTEDGGFIASCNVTVNIPPLTLKGSIGFSTVVTNSGMASGMFVEATPSGGTGNYTYNIKLYYEGSLIGEGTSKELFVNQTSNGTYSATITVVDSDGTSATVTKTITKS